MGEWRHSSTILDHDTRWKRAVSFTPRQLYPSPRGKIWRYPLDKRLGGAQSRSRRCGQESRESNQGRPAHLYTNWAIPVRNRNYCRKLQTNMLHDPLTLGAELCGSGERYPSPDTRRLMSWRRSWPLKCTIQTPPERDWGKLVKTSVPGEIQTKYLPNISI
jgi:hypothetical protein